MKVAVFARGLTKRPSGRGVYAAEMIRALAALGTVELDVFAGDSLDLPGCRFWPARGGSAAGSAWRMMQGIGEDLRTLSPDLFWTATHSLPGNLPSRLPAVATLLDVVWRDHPETMSHGRRWAASWMEKGLHRADRIVCISRFTRSRLIAHWPSLAPRVDVIPLAPNPRLPTAEDDPDVLDRLGLRTPFVLTVGTIEPRKNLGLLIDAAALVPELHVVHCGPPGWKVGPLRDRMRRASNVHALGWTEEAVLAALYRRAVAAVSPSIYEGFDLPALDAASMGCPLVVSDIPVHREVLADAALYAPVDRPDVLAEHLRCLLGSERERRERSHRVRERAAAFGWDRSGRRLHDVFVRTCAEAGRGGC